MGRPLRHAELDVAHELDVSLVLALVAAGAAGTALISYLVWQAYGGSGVDRRSRRLLRQLDSARSLLRRQISAGEETRADETRIRIADLQRAIMQLEGYI